MLFIYADLSSSSLSIIRFCFFLLVTYDIYVYGYKRKLMSLTQFVIIHSLFCPNREHLERCINSVKSIAKIVDRPRYIGKGWFRTDKLWEDFKKSVPALDVERLDRNEGKAKIVNDIAEKIDASWMLLVDHDIVFDQSMTRIGDVVRDTNRDVGAVALDQTGDCRHVSCCYDDPFMMGSARVSDTKGLAAGGCVLVNKIAFYRVGGFPVYSCYFNDEIELWKRMISKGYRILLCHVIKVYHPESCSDDDYLEWKMEKAAITHSELYEESIRDSEFFWSSHK